MPIKAGDIAAAIGAQLVFGDASAILGSVSIDSRSAARGDLFIPLKGERFDGHDFIWEAVCAGAGGFLAERVDPQLQARLEGRPTVGLRVPDTRAALSNLAHLVRGSLAAKVIGITGSTGKTSTKDILAALTGKSFKTLASPRNENNEIGAPLTVTKADVETEVLIVEMGMRGPGQIAALAAMAEPQIGIITNVGLTHFETLGSRENIAAAKAELVAALPPGGYAVLNHDDEWTPYLRGLTAAEVVTFGLKPGADVGAAEISFDEYARPTWRLIFKGRFGPLVNLPVAGRHNIVNALAAVAAAGLVGVAEADIVDGLRRVRLTDMRLSIIETAAGLTVINDAYNANPASMTGALEALMMVKPGSRHVAVLGRMSELGEYTVNAHRDVGAELAAAGIDLLVGVGEHADTIVESALGAGLDPSAAAWLDSKEDAVRLLESRVAPGDVVLVKGSRVAGLEDVVAALTGEK